MASVCSLLLQIKNGSQFVSETDTEVIPKLLKFAYDNFEGEGERLPFPKVGAAHCCRSTWCTRHRVACPAQPLTWCVPQACLAWCRFPAVAHISRQHNPQFLLAHGS